MTKPVIKPPTMAAPKSATPTAPAPITIKFPTPEFTGERGESIIHSRFKGVNLVSGFRGHGKTSYCLKIDNPANIVMIDLEDKGERLAKPLGVGAYFQPLTEAMDVMGASRFDIVAVYDRILQIIDSLPKDRFTTLIIDNAQSLNDGAAQFIRNNAALSSRYGVRPENAISGGFGGAWPGAKLLIGNMIHLANAKGIQVEAVTFQLKPSWKNSQPEFNKWKMTDLTVWHELSILTLVMVTPMAEHYPNRRALVMKEQLSEFKWVPGDAEKGTRGKTIQVRYLPDAMPSATPDALYNYLDTPYDSSNPAPGEKVTALEIAPYSTSFSMEQLFLAERMARAQKELGIGATDESDGD